MEDFINLFPFNLAKDTLRDEKEARKIYAPGISIALASLTEREADILRKRYYDKMTLSAIGEIHGISKERVRQIEAKAIRRLRFPVNKKKYTAVPTEQVEQLQSKYNKLERGYNLLLDAYNLLRGQTPTINTLSAGQCIMLETPVKELELSPRAINCLIRADKQTLRDITETTVDELDGIRNLGKKTAEEIRMYLEKLGFSLKFPQVGNS